MVTDLKNFGENHIIQNHLPEFLKQCEALHIEVTNPKITLEESLQSVLSALYVKRNELIESQSGKSAQKIQAQDIVDINTFHSQIIILEAVLSYHSKLISGEKADG